MGSRAERTHGRAAAGGPGQMRPQLAELARHQLTDRTAPHLCTHKPG